MHFPQITLGALLLLLTLSLVADASSELPRRAERAMRSQRDAIEHLEVQPNDYYELQVYEQNRHNDIDLDLRLGCGS